MVDNLFSKKNLDAVTAVEYLMSEERIHRYASRFFLEKGCLGHLCGVGAHASTGVSGLKVVRCVDNLLITWGP